MKSSTKKFLLNSLIYSISCLVVGAIGTLSFELIDKAFQLFYLNKDDSPHVILTGISGFFLYGLAVQLLSYIKFKRF